MGAATSIIYVPLFKHKVETKGNLIKIKTYEKFLSFCCGKCENENIVIFKGARNYYCSKCGEKISVKIVSKTFRGKLERKKV